MLFIYPYQTIFSFFPPNVIMHTLKITSAIKKMTVNELGDFIYENYYKRIKFARENSYYSIKKKKKKYLQLIATKLT